ncbi:EF-hand domain-containing protein [Ramlibacter sp. G-1-2-2]|uniref:EF-hand domain-containing protein n=1 Tax=Ramlibacter agri TaxID=2728837 RepID=A0A848GYT4_9BURK|nr:EF-hand domain-containing protein [Ramlibacter agri]NML42452.1 EF-hand domain-containing protein [Ramlibacter agri]
MPHAFRIVPVLALALLSAAAAQAQTRSVQGSTSSRPAANTVAAQATPNPAGLRSSFPAGLTAGSGAGTSTDRVAASANPNGNVGTSVPSTNNVAGGFSTGGAIGTTGGVDTGVASPATNVLGAGGAAGPSQYLGSGAGGVNAVDAARAFLEADGNHDGELSRSEFRRLPNPTMSFEQMDRNFDGVISRFEYDDSLQ